VEDNQQGVVASALAALALMREGFHPARPTTLLFVADEEMGSEYGVGWLMKAHGDLFRPGDMALVPDSGDARGESVEVAEKNIAWARFTVRGTQAHGSRPDHGVNAHLAGAALILRLHEDLAKKFDGRDPLFEPAGSTFEPTRKDANVPNVNTIPGEDVFYYDMRILPRYPVDDVLGEVDRVQAAVEAAYGVRVERALVQRMESPATAADAPVVGLLARAAREVYGVTTRPVGIGGGTVAAYLRKAGMDAVVWSRIAGNAHAPDEYALLDNILGDAAVMALMMAEGG